MNKKNSIFSLLLVLMSSLSFSQTIENPVKVVPPLVGGDVDKHGCKPSAGYTFSSLKNDCVRLFEQEIQLKAVDSTQSYATFAAVIFSIDKRKAEIFVPNAESSLILIRKGRKLKWKGKNYELSQAKDYILKKANKVIYRRN